MTAVAAGVAGRRRAVRANATAYAVAGLVLVAAVLRFATLDGQSFWIDEYITVELIRHDFGGMLSGVYAHEATPPFYFIVAWLWTRIFGHGEVGLRSLSALAGTATVPVAYLAGRDLVNRRVGLIAALLVALSPPLLYYSQEGRSYSLLVLLCTASLLFLVRSLKSATVGNHAAFALTSALALATHYFALFLIVPAALLLLWRGADRRRAALAVGAVAVAGLALLPLALHQRVHGGGGWISLVPLHDRLAWTANFFTTGMPLSTGFAWVAGALVLAAALVAVMRSRESEYSNAALTMLGLGLGALAIPFLAAVAPGNNDYVLDRNLLPAWLPLAVVVAVALGLRGRPLVPLLCGAAISLALVACDVRVLTDSQAKRDDWRGVAHALGPPKGGGRVIAVAPQWEGFALTLYMPRLRPMHAAVSAREVDTVAFYGLVPDTRGRITIPPPPFRRVGTTRVQRMVVTRYRSPRPVEVSPVSLTNLELPPFAQSTSERARALP